jgi:hypothetical protein
LAPSIPLEEFAQSAGGTSSEAETPYKLFFTKDLREFMDRVFNGFKIGI